MAKKKNSFFVVGAGTNVTCIPTGHSELDLILSYGENGSTRKLTDIGGYDPTILMGLPRGRIINIYGDEGSGKSSIAYRICGNAQKMGLTAAWVDAENSFSDTLSDLNGCNKDLLHYSDTVCRDDDKDKMFWLEDIFDNIFEKIASGDIDVLVLDSIASLTPKYVGENPTDQETMAMLARCLSKAINKLNNYVAKFGTMVILLNQAREDLSIMYGDKIVQPGGRAVPHYSSVMIKMMKSKSTKNDIMFADPSTGDERVIGRYANVTMKKNRFAKPFRDTLLVPCYYEPYFPDVDSVAFDWARAMKLVSVRQGIFKWGEVRVEGKDAFLQHLKENNLVTDFFNMIVAFAEEGGLLAPVEVTKVLESTEV